MLNAIGGAFAGTPSLNSFNSKAEVIKWAIEFTSTTDDKYNEVPDYDKAQAMYEFVCKNVALPDVPADPQREFFKELKGIIDKELAKKNKEEAIPLPGSSPLAPISNKIRKILYDNNFKAFKGEASTDYSKDIFRLDGDGEYLELIITHSICPKAD